MRTFVSVALLLVLSISACEKETIPADVPGCIQNLIEQIKKDSVWNPPASVWQYTYNNQTVYYIPARCCDIPSALYDTQCNLICNPDGGFSGKGDGKCPDFSKNRKDEKLIWQDERK